MSKNSKCALFILISAVGATLCVVLAFFFLKKGKDNKFKKDLDDFTDDFATGFDTGHRTYTTLSGDPSSEAIKKSSDRIKEAML